MVWMVCFIYWLLYLGTFPLIISTSELRTGRHDVRIFRNTQGRQERIGGVSFTVQRMCSSCN